MKSSALTLALGALCCAHVAFADILEGYSFTSATVRPDGPRPGTSGTNFLNVEGTDNGAFASWGVVDFNVDDFNFAFPVTDVTNLSFSLTENNAAFTTANGGLNFYLTTDTSTSIANDGSSPLFFDTNFSPEGLGSQLATTYLLGSGNFSSNSGSMGTGTIDTYSLSLTGDAYTYFLGQLNTASSTIRLVITPTDAAGASTWSGGTNATLTARPKLTFDATLDQPFLVWIGGTGTWNATGGTDWSGGPWDSTQNAVFQTGSGTVTLGTPVTTTGIKFETDGYTIDGTGAEPLSLATTAGGNIIAVQNSSDTATISAVVDGSTGLQKNGAGALNLTGINTFTGEIKINAGTLAIEQDANLGASTNAITLNQGTLRSLAALQLSSDRFLSGSGTLDGTGGLLDIAGIIDGGTLSIVGSVQFSGSSVSFTTAALAAGSTLTLTAPITNLGRTTFSGDGTAVLNGDNSSNTGGISMSRGAGSVGPTVVMGSSTAFGFSTLFLNAGKIQASSNFTGMNAIQTPISLGGSVTLEGGDMEFAGSFSFFGTSTKRLTVANSTTISTSIGSSGTTGPGDALIKAGAGTLILTTTNGYTGGTQVLLGTLDVTPSGALGTGDVLVVAEELSGAVLRLDINTAIDDLSNVFISNAAGVSQIDLNFDAGLFEVVQSLTINGSIITPGDYSAADLPDYLTGTGNLRVLDVIPEPEVWTLLAFGGLVLVIARIRSARRTA